MTGYKFFVHLFCLMGTLIMLYTKGKRDNLISFLAGIASVNNAATSQQMGRFLDSLTAKEQEIASLFLLRLKYKDQQER
jgi:hypothetical protein